MLEVKLSGSPEEIAALFRQLGAGSTEIETVGNMSVTRRNLPAGSVSHPSVTVVPSTPVGKIAAEDLPDTGATGLEVFGGTVDQPAEADANLAVFGAAPAAAAVPPAPPLPNVQPLPAAAAPTPQAAATPTPGATELDKNGLPWDARIHSESKARNADQTWRAKRNLAPEVKAAVEQELRQLMSHPAPPPAPPAPPLPAAASSTAIQTTGAAATLPPAPPPTTGVAVVDFANIFQRCTAAVAAEKFTQEQLGTMLTRVAGSPVLPLLINRPDLFAAVDQNLTAMGA